MQCAEAKDTAKCSFTTPAARGSDGDGARDVVFMVVDNEAEGSIQVLQGVINIATSQKNR